MKRRDFLKASGPLFAAPLFLNAVPVRSFFPEDTLLTTNCGEVNSRALVIIKLDGGNDGINTIIPISQYGKYARYRPKIRIPDSGSDKYITLDNTLANSKQVGLHPSMQAIKRLYDDGFVNIIQGVGYPLPNRSHFKSSDLWQTGGDPTTPQKFNLDSGWMGRYLETAYADLLFGPNASLTDPLGIHLGSSKVSLGFHTTQEHAVAVGLEKQNLSNFYTFVSGVGGPPPDKISNSDYGKELRFLIEMQNSTNVYAERISSVFDQGQNAIEYPKYKLADQLKTVARLLKGGSQTKIFHTRIGGFDTHVYQKNKHANLLTQFSESVKAFMDDLRAMGIDRRVLVTTYSEFGRKIVENQNQGTDHGTFGPMLVIGAGVQGGVFGHNPNLDDQDKEAIKDLQHDYRKVFGTLIQDWLGADQEAMQATQFDAYGKMSLISSNLVVDPSIYNCRGGSSSGSEPPPPVQQDFIGEVGKISVKQDNRQQWHKVVLKKSYQNPVVLMSPLNFDGSQPCFATVRNIKSASFEFQITEWAYLNGSKPETTLSYLVVEAGTYTLKQGVQLMAGKHPKVDHNATRIGFPASFNKKPLVFPQLIADGGGEPAITRMVFISEKGFQLKLQEAEASNQAHYPEEVCWIAIEPTTQTQGLAFEAGSTGRVVSHDWYELQFSQNYSGDAALMASMQTLFDTDTANIRYDDLTGRGVRLKIEEEKSRDQEVQHAFEEVAYMAFHGPGYIYAEAKGTTPAPPPSSGSVCGNTGVITCEMWNQLGGSAVSDIPVNTTPDQTKLMPTFETAPNQGDFYGLRLRGYICPPQSGQYTFFIAGDTKAELWLSEDDRPQTKKRIAHVPNYTAYRQWNKFPQQRSAKIFLKKGQRYYVEALLKEDIGGDHLSVGWQRPDGTQNLPIPGQWLQAWGGGQSVPITDQCQGTGQILWETWYNLPGPHLDKVPFDTNAQKKEFRSIFESPTDMAEAYGGRLRGFICPPQTGNYTFYIAADYRGELYLSNNYDPANKVLIASVPRYTSPRQWDKFPAQKSQQVYLIKGVPYYVEARMKEDIVNDHLAVGWQRPDRNFERPILGKWLIPWTYAKFQELKQGNFQASNREIVAQDTSPFEVNRELSINCYPNTFTKHFDLAIGNPSSEQAWIQIFNSNGKLVFYQEMRASDEATRIEAGHFQPGLYIVKVVVGSEVKTTRVVKQ